MNKKSVKNLSMKRFLRNHVVSTFQKYGIHNIYELYASQSSVVSTFQKYGIHNANSK